MGKLTERDLVATIECALIYDVEDEGDTHRIVETIFDGVVKALQRDTRFPRLTRTDYDLLFADLIKEAHGALLQYWKIDTERAAQVIAEEVIDKINEDTHERGKDRQADQAAVR